MIPNIPLFSKRFLFDEFASQGGLSNERNSLNINTFHQNKKEILLFTKNLIN